jgi:hypothetical protein
MRGQLRFELARSVAVASLCPVPTRLRFFAAQAATPFTKSSKPKRGRRPSLSKSHAVFAADRLLPAKGSSSSNTSCCGKRFRVRVSAVLNGPGRDSLLPQRRLKQAAGDVGGVGWAALLSALSGVLRLWQSITKLVELGYLQPGARHRATAVERAIDRLRTDLVRQGVVYDSNLPSSPKDEDQQRSTQIGERGS